MARNVSFTTRARNLIIEAASAKKLLKTYGNKLANRLSGDSSVHMLQHEINESPGDTQHEKVTNYITKHAPHAKYHDWLVKNYANGGINKLDDLSKAHEALNIYHKHAAHIEPKDIHQVKGLHHLQEITEPHAERKTKSEERDATEKELEPERTMVHDSKEHQVVIPHTERASIHYGKNTKWCTAATGSRNYFNDYSPHGNLFYFLHKPTNKRHAIFVPHKPIVDGEYQAPEAFDEEDRPISPREVTKIHDPAVDHMTHQVNSILHRVNMNLPKPDPEFAPTDTGKKNKAKD